MRIFFIIIIGLLMWQWARAQSDSLKTVQLPPLPTKPTIDVKDCISICMEMPRFPGCEDLATIEERKACADKKMLGFIYTNIIYPKSLDHISLESKVLISFIVEKNGSLSNFKIIQGANEELNKEVLRIAQMMPNFIPGKDNGQAVRTRIYLPIRICLE